MDETPAQRLRIALDLFEVGERMQRQRLRREHPSARDDEVEAMVVRWLHHRPGAEHGDSSGTPSRRFA